MVLSFISHKASVKFLLMLCNVEQELDVSELLQLQAKNTHFLQILHSYQWFHFSCHERFSSGCSQGKSPSMISECLVPRIRRKTEATFIQWLRLSTWARERGCGSNPTLDCRDRLSSSSQDI